MYIETIDRRWDEEIVLATEEVNRYQVTFTNENFATKVNRTTNVPTVIKCDFAASSNATNLKAGPNADKIKKQQILLGGKSVESTLYLCDLLCRVSFQPSKDRWCHVRRRRPGLRERFTTAAPSHRYILYMWQDGREFISFPRRRHTARAARYKSAKTVATPYTRKDVATIP